MIVAQISDIHAAPSNDNLLRLNRALSWLSALEPDALVVSGDLIDDDWTDGYAAIAARLEALNCPFMLVPGNSDDRQFMRTAFATRYGAVDDCDAMHFRAQIGGLGLVGIDTCLPGTSAGDVVQHLAWLERVLEEPASCPTLLFAHHHFVPSGIAPMDAVIAEGKAELGDLLTRRSLAPIAISSGHVHRPMSAMLAGIPAHICGSICPANPLWFGGRNIPGVNEPPMIMVHRLTGDGLVSSHVAV
ncbi:metallophosphoesterase [Rhizobium phaseoli]|uniref:metallophosphoesterase n=1 Tax=Rhizobium phaseoli TaxID=396 RepID=UPI000F87702A|nr:metallophosphoesterase [Rhizobium phaseoli]RUM16883.1 metallophosphoesterase [Rhizobium phaseoli]